MDDPLFKRLRKYVAKIINPALEGFTDGRVNRAERHEGPNDNIIASALTFFAGTVSSLNIVSTLQIFWFTETAHPGDEIAIQGSFSSTATISLVLNDGVNFINAKILSQRDGFIKAQIPASLPLGVYQIFIKEGSDRSAVKYINQAQGYGFDTPEVYPGAKVSLIGINLFMPGKTPVIKFVSQADQSTTFGVFELTGSDEYKMNFTAPVALVAGVVYNVYVSNGHGGKIAETLVSSVVTCIPAATDVFKLGVAWHARFTNTITKNKYNIKIDTRISHAAGDGVTNDLPAIQAAIDAASAAGGGIIFLPPGEYLCADAGRTGISLKSNVVLQGAGMDVTSIVYGTGLNMRKFIDLGAELSTTGITDLTMKCRDATGAAGAGLIRGNTFFLKNVKWDLKAGDWIEFNKMSKVAVLDCELMQGANVLIHGPLYVSACKWVTIKKNKLTSVSHQLNTTNSQYCFVENNILIRDAITQRITGSVIHCLISNFVSDSIYYGNSIITNGPIPRKSDNTPINNDGESIICEDSNYYDYDYGTVTAATDSSLTDSTKAWPATFDRAPVVAIINGKGMGQVRKIMSRTSTSLTVAPAWDITPDSTSAYSIFNMCLERVTYKSNYLVGQQRGFTLYNVGMQKINIDSNHLMNSGSIDITVRQASNKGKNIFTPVYNININNNSADATKDLYNGTSIGIQAIQHIVTHNLGTICYNLRMLNNTLVGPVPNKDVIQDEKFTNSFNNYMIFHIKDAHFVDSNVPFILGTIIAGNTAKNIEKVVHLNTGSYQTSVKSTTQVNSPQLILDDMVSGASHASVETIII